MTKEEIIKLARKAGLVRTGDGWTELHRWGMAEIEAFAALVAAAERNKLAAWMMAKAYATGHGDTVEDLLKELEWQVRESEREACAALENEPGIYSQHDMAEAIRARGQA